MSAVESTSHRRFLSTPSARRATCNSTAPQRPANYFYPRPPRGGRPAEWGFLANLSLFLSTPSARRATWPCSITLDESDFYPRPPRGGRPRAEHRKAQEKAISIHALREEGDDFSETERGQAIAFLSTPSARRATHIASIRSYSFTISIHALREEGDIIWLEAIPPARNFYPRPPRGGRLTSLTPENWNVLFLSTPSARRATRLLPS